MKLIKVALILIVLVLSIGIASASDDNSTADSLLLNDEASTSDVLQNGTDKEVPEITISSSSGDYKGSIDIYLKDKNGNPLSKQNLTTIISNTNTNHKTDSKGKVSLKLDFKPGSYLLDVRFAGNDDFAAVNKTFNIKILKLDSVLNPHYRTVITGDYFYVFLKDKNGGKITGEKITFKVNGMTYYANTNNNGKAGFKVKFAVGTYAMTIFYNGNEYYNSVSITLNLVVPATTTLTIGNTRLLSNGFLRIYLKSATASAISKKVVTIKVGSKTFKKTTNTEGIILFKPKVGKGTFKVTATFAGASKIIGSSAQKSVKGINGNVKNPFNSKIPLKNGVPDVDLMSAYYVMGDGDATYTLTKAQYRDVIKRDSYCLFLNNKMSKFVFFKTKKQPKLNHIVKREKWNVIERAVDTKLVLKNKKNYWPASVTVSLKGKSYTYPEVRDIQNTGYTCGPTSSSMCTQVLRNYVNEKYMSQLSGTTYYSGSSTKGLKHGLEKKNFKCTIYYKSSFNKALKELKKGGCALVFHTWNHYIAILDISKDGKKVLVGNPSGDYNHGSHSIPTNWLTVKYMKGRFNNYDTSGLIVKLKYNINKSTKKKVNMFYSNMGKNWQRKNTSERLVDVGA